MPTGSEEAGEAETRKTLQSQAWSYFQLHASQRIATFNFFIVLAGLLLNAIVAAFNRTDPQFVWIGSALGAMLIIISFTFWELDQRNRQLIGLAEEALISYEAGVALPLVDDQPNPLRLFSREVVRTANIRRKQSWFPLSWLFSYALCFRIIFVLFGLSGVASVLIGLSLSAREERVTVSDWLSRGSIPPELIRSMKEADQAYNAKAFGAAALVLRQALYDVVQDQSTISQNQLTLADRVRVLAAEGKITKSVADAAAGNRVFGGLASEIPRAEQFQITDAEVRGAHEIVRQVLGAFYVNPALLRSTALI